MEYFYKIYNKISVACKKGLYVTATGHALAFLYFVGSASCYYVFSSSCGGFSLLEATIAMAYVFVALPNTFRYVFYVATMSVFWAWYMIQSKILRMRSKAPEPILPPIDYKDDINTGD